MGAVPRVKRPPAPSPAETRRCAICADPIKKEWVGRRLMEGFSLSQIEAQSRVNPMVSAIKRETISKHKSGCLQIDIGQPQVAKTAQHVTKGLASEMPSDDVAVLVQREVVKKLRDGEARVTVQHGLQAQQLLDRRAERAKDRELAVTLARMLHAPAPPVGAVRERIDAPVVIEDVEYEVVG